MVGLLITGHGHFATGLESSLKLITGITKNIVYVDFEADHSIKDLAQNMNRAFDALRDCDGVLVLADLAGGSPFKCAVECKFARLNQEIEVIAGSNLPMLLEASMRMGGFDSPLALAESLILAGRECIFRFVLKEHVDDVGEDGI